jgi:hypothetical protein
MACYKVHRIKDTPGENFRWAAHTGGLTVVKPKDYDIDGLIEAATPYAAWKCLADEGHPLRTGDVLETADSEETPPELRIFKYIGFEPASWWSPEPKPETEAACVAALSIISASPVEHRN